MKRRFSCLLLCAMLVFQMFALSACGECDHDWDDWEIEKEATCEEEGLKVRECNECGEEEEKEIKALGHIEEDMEDIAPTCDKEGSEGGIKCGLCEARCPQKLPIRTYLEKIGQEVEARFAH